MSPVKHLQKSHRLISAVAIIVVLVGSTTPGAQSTVDKDPLALWKEARTKRAILDFVRRVTDKSGPGYVKPEERVAAFDDDGTLWAEWPRHINQIQMVFSRQRVKAMAKDHPLWKYQEPYRSILEHDNKALARNLEDIWNRLDLVRTTNGGMTVDEFGATVRSFVASARHPQFKVPYWETAYAPMLELLEFLRANEFKIYIVTGSGADFMRELSEKVFGVPRECVIGTTPEYEYVETAEGGFLRRRDNVDIFNNKSAKAENIQLHVGRVPIFVAGNDDNDVAIMGLAAGGKHPFLNLVVRHDDADREFAYNDNTTKILEKANANGWTIVSMKSDFKIVFSFRQE